MRSFQNRPAYPISELQHRTANLKFPNRQIKGAIYYFLVGRIGNKQIGIKNVDQISPYLALVPIVHRRFLKTIPHQSSLALRFEIDQ